MEPPRPCLPARARPSLLSATVPRVRIRRRADIGSEKKGAETRGQRSPAERWWSAVFLVAALVLAVASRGDVVVLAVLLGFGAGRRASAFASAAALVAAMVRWGSPSLHAIAGAQAVLGPAGWTGSTAAIASAWLAGLALVCAGRPAVSTAPLVDAVALAPFAAAAADVVVGPSAGGAVGLRVVGSVAAFGAALAAGRWRRAPQGGCALGVLALVAAGLAR